MFTNRGTASTGDLSTGCGLPFIFDADSYNKITPQSPSSLSATLDELVLRGFVARGLAPTVICDLLSIEQKELDQRLSLCGLICPEDRKVRKRHKRGWLLREEHALLRFWSRNYTPTLMAELLSRSVNSVQAKARRLGLYTRDRRSLVSDAPVFEAWKANQSKGKKKRIRLTDDVLLEIRDRWIRRQSSEGIVLDLGLDMTAGALSAKASRVGLPDRCGRVSLTIDATCLADLKLAANAVKCRCSISGKIFFGTSTQRWSPTTRTSATFRDLVNADAYGFA